MVDMATSKKVLAVMRRAFPNAACREVREQLNYSTERPKLVLIVRLVGGEDVNLGALYLEPNGSWCAYRPEPLLCVDRKHVGAAAAELCKGRKESHGS